MRSTQVQVPDNESALHREREFVFTETDFRRVRGIVYEYAGIQLSDAKRDLVYSRLARRVRALHFDDFGHYLDHVETSGDGEFTEFLNAITTNLTSFFRERHHFDALRQTMLPQLMKARASSRRLRVWSAGCSTGEEPYSIAMTLRDVMPEGSGWDARILATDLDTNVLAHARAGVYNEERIQQLPDSTVRRWFRRGRGGHKGKVRVAPELQPLITFNQLNLMEPWPMRGKFDVIFCRNVVIYFDKATQAKLFDRFADALADDGFLIVGHSETLYRVTDRFELIGQTMYRKKSSVGAARRPAASGTDGHAE